MNLLLLLHLCNCTKSIDIFDDNIIFISKLRFQIKENNCGNLVEIVEQINDDLVKNINTYINKIEYKEYKEYIFDIIYLISENINSSEKQMDIISRLFKHMFKFLMIHDIEILEQMLSIINIFSDKLLTSYINDEIYNSIADSDVIKGISLIHYPLSYPCTTVIYDYNKILAIRKEYKILNNIENTIACKENKLKYLPYCDNNEIAYVDHIRSIYYAKTNQIAILSKLKLFIMYLNLVPNLHSIPTGIYTYENTCFNLIILLSFQKIEKYVVLNKCILYIILDRLISYKKEDFIPVSTIYIKQSDNENSIFKIIIYDYFISLENEDIALQKIILNILFEYIKLVTTNYKLTKDKINTLVDSLEYMCKDHDGRIYVEMNFLLKIKLGIDLITILLINSKFLKASNVSNIKFILKIKDKMYVEKIINTIERWLIKQFNIIIIDFQNEIYEEMLNVSEIFINSVIYLFEIYDSSLHCSRLIAEFCKSIMESKINSYLELLYSKTYNTILDVVMLFLCMLIYESYYHNMIEKEKSNFKKLLYTVLCKNNPKNGNILFASRYCLLAFNHILYNTTILPSLIKSYIIGNSFRYFNNRTENIVIDSNNIIESTKFWFEKIGNLRFIKWNIEFIDRNINISKDLKVTWMNLLVHEIKHSSLNLFEKVNGMNYYHPSLRINSSEKILSYYELTGMLIGISLSNDILFKLELTPTIYKKILGLSCDDYDFIKENKIIYDEIMNTESSNLKKIAVRVWKNDKVVYMRRFINVKNIINKETYKHDCLKFYKKIYLEIGIKDQIKFLLNGMSKIINLKYLNGLNEKELKRLIYGYENYSAKEIISVLRFDNKISELEKCYFKAFINQSTNKDINTMLRNIIGHDYITGEKYIYITKPDPQSLLIRCGFENMILEIPTFTDYVSFKKAMICFLEYPI